jgi:hypothetical protein
LKSEEALENKGATKEKSAGDKIRPRKRPNGPCDISSTIFKGVGQFDPTPLSSFRFDIDDFSAIPLSYC